MVISSDFFSTPELAQRLDLLRHLIENSELLPVVRGAAGVGKSAIVAQLRKQAPESWQVCLVDATPLTQPDVVISTICRCFGIAQEEQWSKALSKHFQMLRAQGVTPVILVDDAHELPHSAIITLMRIFEKQIDGRPQASLVLFGNPQVDTILTAAPIRAMATDKLHVIDLPVISLEHVRAFMEFIIRAEELPARLGLNNALLERIHRETGGRPGALASSILDALGEAEEGAASSKASNMAVIKRTGIAVVVLLLGGVLLFQEQINRLIDPGVIKRGTDRQTLPVESEMLMLGELDQLVPAPKQTPAEVLRQEPALVLANQSDVEAGQAPASPPVQIDSAPATPAESVQIPEAKAPADAESPEPESMPVEVAEVPSEQQPVSTDDEVAVVDEPVMVDEVTASEPEENPELLQQAVDAAPEVGGEDEARTAAEFESEQSSDATAVTETEEVETAGESPTVVAEVKQELELLPAAGLLEAASVKDKKGDSPAQTSEPFRRDAWLKSQKPDAFAIQMLGVGRLESLLEFVRRHGLEERAIYFESRRNNKPWHVLLWGVYPDRKSAKAAQAELPASLRRKTLWIRGLGSIQSSMLESPR